MSAETSILTRKLRPQDLFLIFAIDGPWEQLSDEAVVQIFHMEIRSCAITSGIARYIPGDGKPMSVHLLWVPSDSDCSVSK
uniref:Probable protein phosphatase 2C 63 n=1 Tax=Tanacetum cinerariifolium TaxID=118510 RepID=A0A699HDJ0_TANCI|nr:probable protein phosphatase 2C 63 [Tanacetum cinerariifolium]